MYALRTRICDLEVGMRNTYVVGAIIAKHNCKSFKEENSGRKVAQMTLTDSPGCSINAVFWVESSEISDQIDNNYAIGDFIEIFDPKVTSCKSGDDRYLPSTSSKLTLTFSEAHSRLNKPSFEDGLEIGLDQEKLQRFPLKPITNFILISDIQNPNRVNPGDFIDVLAAIRSIFPAREVKGGTGVFREIRLFDQSHDKLALKIWDEEWVKITENLVPKQDILFLADVRADYDQYRGCMALTATKKSVITVNPVGSLDTKLLSDYAKTADFSQEFSMEKSLSGIDPESVKKISSVLDLQDKHLFSSDSTFATLIFGFVTKFDIDGGIPVGIRKCKFCRNLIKRDKDCCDNMDCRHFNDPFSGAVQGKFRVRADIADFTGTLPNCQFEASAMERLLDCTFEDFCALDDNSKTEAKWSCLLQPAKICVAILKNENSKQNFTVILDWKSVTMNELVDKMPIPPVK